MGQEKSRKVSWKKRGENMKNVNERKIYEEFVEMINKFTKKNDLGMEHLKSLFLRLEAQSEWRSAERMKVQLRDLEKYTKKVR